MKIVTYKELESKDSLLPLLDHAFGWTFNPRTFETLVKMDPRLKDGPIILCAVENRTAIGTVGVLDLPTRTQNGEIEHVGGIYGVATLPSHTRRGVSTALMTAAHDYFKERGYRFSFLWTSRTLVAHAMYEKLGYTDLFGRQTAHKVLHPKKTRSAKKKEVVKSDLSNTLKLYDEYVKSRTGFVVRDEAYLNMLRRTESLSAKDYIFDENGYVIFKTNVGGPWIKGTWIRELLALNAEAMSRLLGLVEEKSKDLIYDRAVFDDALLKVYRSSKYTIQKRSHGVLMIKPLTNGASFSHTYGPKFYLTSLDFF
jgi:GNAT superfamily N-acetyltransferase